MIATPKYGALAESLSNQSPITDIGKFDKAKFDSNVAIELSSGFPSGGVNGYPGMLFACFVDNTYKGIAYQSYTSHSGDTTYTGGTKKLKDLFYPNVNRNCHLYVINANGTVVNGTGSTIYSDNQQPGTNGYNQTSRFAADDGAWGLAIGTNRLDGNGGHTCTKTQATHTDVKM